MFTLLGSVLLGSCFRLRQGYGETSPKRFARRRARSVRQFGMLEFGVPYGAIRNAGRIIPRT